MYKQSPTLTAMEICIPNNDLLNKGIGHQAETVFYACIIDISIC